MTSVTVTSATYQWMLLLRGCSLVILLLLPGQGSGQCYQSLNCTGSVTVSDQSTLRDCCVNTDDGLSWMHGDGSCRDCIVHGFTCAKYIVSESNPVIADEFKLFVKGQSLSVTQAPPRLPGLLRSIAVTAVEDLDYRFSEVSTNNLPVKWQLDIVDDDIALEYDDHLRLLYYPSSSPVGSWFEERNHFIRSVVPVYIEDNDRLEIRFDDNDYSVHENGMIQSEGISLSVSKTQESFTMEIIPTAVDVANTTYHLSHSLSLNEIMKENHAVSGADFNNESFVIRVPAKNTTVRINNITIVDDDINEKEEVFILVARILGPATDVACFQLEGSSVCKSNASIGGTRIRIGDDDGMFIGFAERASFVRENMFTNASEFFRTIQSLRASENEFKVNVVMFGLKATVTDFSNQIGMWDVSFRSDSLYTNVPNQFHHLHPGDKKIVIRGIIMNDIISEVDETFSMTLSPLEPGVDTRGYECYGDNEDPVQGNYFCSHTVTIVDDDAISIGWEKTVYTATESSSVEVCGVADSTKPVTVIVHSQNGTAVEMLNYERVHMTLGPFTIPRKPVCFELTIPDNNNCTEPMNFTIVMSPREHSEDDVIITNPVTAIVIDDSMEPECSTGDMNTFTPNTSSDGTHAPAIPPDTSGITGSETLAATVTPMVLVTLVTTMIAVVIVIYLLRMKRTRAPKIPTLISERLYVDIPQQPLVQQLLQQLPRRLIFSKDQIHLSSTVGQGETGLVYKAYLNTAMGTQLVAVKTAKALFSTIDVKKLTKEIDTMLSFDHPNVMSLIGVSVDREVPFLIMPFMANGSVLTYVKHHKEELLNTSEATEAQVMTSRKLMLGMCHQIAKGMEYLAKYMFVHRDLAARNCMIDVQGVVKVADFGLTEDMYATKYHRQEKSEEGVEERLPIRWMAPESIENNIYNEKTDVWAFGVTCWEIFTCGRVPYYGISAMGLLTSLKNGDRLEKPNNCACSDEIYDIMTICWHDDPRQRSKFAVLAQQLSDLLEQEAGYLDLNTPVHWVQPWKEASMTKTPIPLCQGDRK